LDRNKDGAPPEKRDEDMMIVASKKRETSIREKYENLTVPIGRALAKIGFTPISMTILSIVIAVVSLYFFYRRELPIAFLAILVSGICDILDGSIARATGKASNFGTLIDNTADRIVEGILMLGFILGGYVEGWIATMTLLAMFLPSYIRARGEAELGIYARGVGIFERKEKLGVLFGGIVIECAYPGFILDFKVCDVPIKLTILSIACLIVTIGSIISAFQRIVFFSRGKTTS